MSEERSVSSGVDREQELTSLSESLVSTQERVVAITQSLEELKTNLITDTGLNLANISLEEALAEAEIAEGEEEITAVATPQETDFDWERKHLVRSKIRLESITLRTQLDRVNDELKGLSSQVRQIDFDQRIDRRNDGLYEHQRRGASYRINKAIRGVFVGLKTGAQNIKKSQLSRQMEPLNTQQIETRDRLRVVVEAAEVLDRQLIDEFISNLETGVKNITQAWNEHAERVSGSNWVAEEVTNAYIEENLAPVLDQAVSEGSLTQEQVADFMVALDNFLDARAKKDQGGANGLWKQMHTDHRVACNLVNDQLNFLDNSIDNHIVEKFVAHQAHAQISSLKDQLSSGLNHDATRKAYTTFGRHLKFSPISVEKNMGRNSLEAFSIFKKSESAKVVFGQLIPEIDQQIYEELLEKSLTDLEGEFIDALEYYPTPDAIKQLVILAAADRVGFRTTHANWVFQRLAAKDNWSTLLDHAVENIEELADVSGLLLNWDFGDQHNHPQIKHVANRIALRVLHDEEEKDKLRYLAQESLLNHTYIVELVQKGLIDDESYQTYRHAYALLHGLSQREIVDWDSSEATVTRNFQTSLWHWEDQARKILKQIEGEGKGGENASNHQQLLEEFHRFTHLGNLWLESKNDDQKLAFMSSYSIIGLLQPDEKGKVVSSEQLAFLSRDFDNHSELRGENSYLILTAINSFPDYFITDEGLKFLQSFSATYSNLYSNLEYPNYVLGELLSAVGARKLSPEQALVLHQDAPDLLVERLAIKYPGVFMTDIKFGREFLQAYDADIAQKMASHIDSGSIPRDIVLAYIKLVPSIFGEEQESLRNYIFKHGKTLTTNESDLKFLNQLIGKHGGKSLNLIKEYVGCIEAGVVNVGNRDKVLAFTLRFRVLSPTIVEGYLKADKISMGEGYIAELQQAAEKLVSSKSLSEEERTKPYFNDLIRAIYSNHSDKWTTYESNESCGDRSSDLESFSYKSKYEIDLFSSAEVRVKEGETLDRGGIDSLKQSILSLAKDMEVNDFEPEKIQAELIVDVDEHLKEIKSMGGLEGIDISQLENIDEKIFLLLVDSIYGTRQIGEEDLKKLILRSEFAFFDDIRAYIQGTTDRVSQANNQDYALMCELHSFFADRIKELNRRAVRMGWENKSIGSLMPTYFKQLSREKAKAQTADELNRLRVDRLGLSDSFIQQVSRTLEKRRGRKYSSEQVVGLIEYYEKFTGGLMAKKSASEKGATQAFYGQLRAQREKTLSAIETITGEKVDPQNYNLGDINLEDLAISLAELETDSYDEEQFKAFTALRFINLFADEKNLLEIELDKFESESGSTRQVINGFITKSKESAHARMVGGVCVSGDNPLDKNGHNRDMNMWDESNFFQFVLQDPETQRCQGLVMLHHFEEDGQKVLAASFNPSSTYIYSVDEASLFEGIIGELENFAKENNFDMILMSQNKAIRTNRTQGVFEKTMESVQQQINKTFSFKEEKRFSFNPNYTLKDMDVIWEKE